MIKIDKLVKDFHEAMNSECSDYIIERADFLFNFIWNFVISYILKFAGIYPYFLTFLLKNFLIEM